MEIYFSSMPSESSLPTSVLKPRVGTLTDTNTLAIGFLPPILMLIFMQTAFLHADTIYLCTIDIFKTQYDPQMGNHHSPTSTCPKELVPIA